MELDQIELLLIEDNPNEAELAIRNLKKHNLAERLVHVDDGAEALDLIFSRGKYQSNKNHKFSPKLILLDLKLPKVSGHEILQQIRSDARTQYIPVVILSSSAEEMDIQKCYKLGANSYIVKPVSFDVFSKAIGELGVYWMTLNKQPA